MSVQDSPLGDSPVMTRELAASVLPPRVRSGDGASGSLNRCRPSPRPSSGPACCPRQSPRRRLSRAAHENLGLRRGGARTMTSDDIWDVVVVGAGPAGSSAALAALHERPDARVLLLDRADFPRDKSCGDGVAPHVLDVLEQLGAHDVADGLRRDHSPLTMLQLALGGLEVERPMRRPALVVPRVVLDARLVDAAVA